MGCPWIIQSLDTTLPSVDSQAFLPFRERNCQGACPPMSFPAQAVCTSQVRSFASALPQVRRREASGSGRVGDSGGCQILWPEQKREEESHGCQGSVYDRNENPVLAKITELASCGMAPAPLLLVPQDSFFPSGKCPHCSHQSRLSMFPSRALLFLRTRPRTR